jgi:hypothetical protein
VVEMLLGQEQLATEARKEEDDLLIAVRRWKKKDASVLSRGPH